MASKVDDLMLEYAALGFTVGSIGDRIFAFLRSKGGTGSMSDMIKQKRTGGIVTSLLDPSEVP